MTHRLVAFAAPTDAAGFFDVSDSIALLIHPGIDSGVAFLESVRQTVENEFNALFLRQELERHAGNTQESGLFAHAVLKRGFADAAQHALACPAIELFDGLEQAGIFR